MRVAFQYLLTGVFLFFCLVFPAQAKLVISGAYSFGDRMNLRETLEPFGKELFPSARASYDISLHTNRSPGVGLEWRDMISSEWAYAIGGTYFPLSWIDSGVVNGESISYADYQKPKLEMTLLHLNAIFSPNQTWYLFAGPNYALFTAKDFGWAKFNSTIGYQYGIGYQFNEHFLFEAMYRSIAINGSFVFSDSSEYYQKYNGSVISNFSGDLNGFEVQTKWMF